MPDSAGRIRPVSISRVPWHDQEKYWPPSKELAKQRAATEALIAYQEWLIAVREERPQHIKWPDVASPDA